METTYEWNIELEPGDELDHTWRIGTGATSSTEPQMHLRIWMPRQVDPDTREEFDPAISLPIKPGDAYLLADALRSAAERLERSTRLSPEDLE
jgi:hypothetical protein